MKPLPQERIEFRNKVIPTEIRNFYNVNQVDTFQFDRPYHREKKDSNNESKVGTETAVDFLPGSHHSCQENLCICDYIA